MLRVTLLFLITATLSIAADKPLYVFDNGAGRGELSMEEQTRLAKRTGYAGIFYAIPKNTPEFLAAHKRAGLRLLGIYTGMNVSDAKPGYDPALPAAIEQLKGTKAIIGFNVNGKAANGDDLAVATLREVADMAAKAGLRVAIYPHYGMHVARIEDALRIIAKVQRPNVGLVFNLCHWLRSGDEPNLDLRLKQAAPHMYLATISGSEHDGDWDRLIQPLDKGTYDVKGFVRKMEKAGYQGPVLLQCYNIKGDREQNLHASMKAWRGFWKQER